MKVRHGKTFGILTLLVLLSLFVYILTWERVDEFMIGVILQDYMSQSTIVDIERISDGVGKYGGRVRGHNITGDIIVVRPGKFIYPSWRITLTNGKIMAIDKDN